MPGKNNSSAFSLIEIMVALMIVVMMATIAVPQFTKLIPGRDRKKFLASFESMIVFAKHNAEVTGKIHKILFDTRERLVAVEITTGGSDQRGQLQSVPIKQAPIKTRITIPRSLEFRHFVIEGVDEFAQGVRKEVWFYVIPDGMVQDVRIAMVDVKDLVKGRSRPLSLEINPFNGRLKVYDEITK